jgi:hypothetical protein
MKTEKVWWWSVKFGMNAFHDYEERIGGFPWLTLMSYVELHGGVHDITREDKRAINLLLK